MFSRTATRVIQTASAPLKMSSRMFATAPSGGTNNTAVLAGAAAAIGAGSYYAFSTSAVSKSAKDAETKIGEAASAAKEAIKEAFSGGEQGFVPLSVESVNTLSHNTKIVRFKLPEADQTSGMHAASALLTRFTPEGEDKSVIRPYTPVSDDDAKGFLDLLVKRYEGGKMSSHIHNLAPGDKLDIKGPISKYPWSPNKHEQIALIAGGTGITPMYQLIKGVLHNAEVDKTKITLVYGNIAEEDILLHKELRELENTYPQRFRSFFVLEKPPAEWQGSKGYVTKELLKQVLPEPKAENFKVFVCGPPGMMKAISGPKNSPSDQGELAGLLQELGYTKEQVLKF
ncbi:NADH-cytochrome b5 reductase [Sporothrix epigloea]|uniref:NADH-cytochrome b5 reductase n=1 Tax=Sporothrix epigloea TaxID=1892477 RepID=A0ABP0DZB9_9PEZI